MTRNLVLTIIGCVLLSFVLATVCHLAFPDIVPYTAGEDEASSWRREIAFLITASAWLSAEVAGLFAIVLVARLRNPSADASPKRAVITRKASH
jgi:CBS domain containing-hemolysin-like protein